MYSIDYLYQIFGDFENFLYFCAPKRRGARVVEEARLESVYTPKGYPGFESLSLRWKELQNKENPCKLILYRDFCFWCIAKISISKHSFGVLFGVPDRF